MTAAKGEGAPVTIETIETEAAAPAFDHAAAIELERACKIMDQIEPPYSGEKVEKAVRDWRRALIRWGAEGRRIGRQLLAAELTTTEEG